MCILVPNVSCGQESFVEMTTPASMMMMMTTTQINVAFKLFLMLLMKFVNYT